MHVRYVQHIKTYILDTVSTFVKLRLVIFMQDAAGKYIKDSGEFNVFLECVFYCAVPLGLGVVFFCCVYCVILLAPANHVHY